jgi:hypothetical protein
VEGQESKELVKEVVRYAENTTNRLNSTQRPSKLLSTSFKQHPSFIPASAQTPSRGSGSHDIGNYNKVILSWLKCNILTFCLVGEDEEESEQETIPTSYMGYTFEEWRDLHFQVTDDSPVYHNVFYSYVVI